MYHYLFNPIELCYILFSSLPVQETSYTGIGMSNHTLLHNHILLLFINILPPLATAFHHLFTMNIFQSFHFPLVSSSPPKLLCDLTPTQQSIYTIRYLCNTLNVSSMALADQSKTFGVLKNQSFPSINDEMIYFLICGITSESLPGEASRTKPQGYSCPVIP